MNDKVDGYYRNRQTSAGPDRIGQVRSLSENHQDEILCAIIGGSPLGLVAL